MKAPNEVSATIAQAASYQPARQGKGSVWLKSLASRFLPNRTRQWLKQSYVNLLGVLTRGRGLGRTLPCGEKIRVLPAHRHMAWNLAEYRAFRACTSPTSVVLDVGANLGAYSMLFGLWVNPGGRVYSFEPAPTTFADLQRHISLNGLQNVVSVVNAAVADCGGTRDFLVDNPHGMNRLSGSTADRSSRQVVPVECITIDEFCRKSNIYPDVIKIDVEGFELAVLRGARETLRGRNGVTPATFVELHPTTWKELGQSREDLARELDSLGLEPVPLNDGDDVWNVEGRCVRLRPVELAAELPR